MCRAAFRVLSSLCLLLPFVLNCVAKVQTYLETCKHFPKNLCIFNLLQQIKLICAVFIQILSTKSIKCAIYKANIFVFRLITYVPYIITNNNANFVVCLQRVVVGYSVGSAAKHHHYKRNNVAPDFSPPLQIWDVSLSCSCAVVGVPIRGCIVTCPLSC